MELLTFSLWGILPIYRKWFTNPSHFFSGKNIILFGTRSLIPYRRLIFPYQGLIFRELRDLETRKFMDKNLLHISLLYPFIHHKLAKSGRMTDLGTWNSRRAVMRLASRRTPRLSQTGLWISRLGSAYQFEYDRWDYTASHHWPGIPWAKQAEPWAHRVVGLKTTILTMPPFPGLEFCTFLVGENAAVLNIECTKMMLSFV